MIPAGLALTLALALAPACGGGGDDDGGADPADASSAGGDDDATPGDDASAPEPFITLLSQTGVASGDPGGDLVPGGMVAGHFDFPAGGLHTRLDGTMRVEVNPGETTSYFFAQQFWFADGDGGYMGLQTNGVIGSEAVGKMLIFSIWEALGAAPGPDATCQTFGGEGVGYSCRLPFDWQPDVAYRLRLEQTDSDDEWRVTVSGGGDAVVLGDIQVPWAAGPRRPTSAVFTSTTGRSRAARPSRSRRHDSKTSPPTRRFVPSTPTPRPMAPAPARPPPAAAATPA